MSLLYPATRTDSVIISSLRLCLTQYMVDSNWMNTRIQSSKSQHYCYFTFTCEGNRQPHSSWVILKLRLGKWASIQVLWLLYWFRVTGPLLYFSQLGKGWSTNDFMGAGLGIPTCWKRHKGRENSLKESHYLVMAANTWAEPWLCK